jgi:hypothetical protein
VPSATCRAVRAIASSCSRSTPRVLTLVVTPPRSVDIFDRLWSPSSFTAAATAANVFPARLDFGNSRL